MENNNIAVLNTPLTDIEGLAKLDIISYGQTREATAKVLGVSASLLDKAVAEAKAKIKAAERAAAVLPDASVSPQMMFALTLKSGVLASMTDSFAARGGSIFRWIKTHWEIQPAKLLEMTAIHYLYSVVPDKTNEKLAQSAVATAALFLPLLPERAAAMINGLPAPLIPTRSGYLEFDANGQVITLRKARQEDGLTYVLDCEYDPLATASRFAAFLCEALPDSEIRAFLQEFAGYTLLGDTRHELAAWLIGEGGTGKGTFGVVMQALHRKTVALNLDALDGFRLCGLADASLVYVDETPTGRINEQTVKTAISGDLMTADIKNRDPITFAPTAKWIINGNNLPPLSDHTTGFWRRFVIFPFDVRPAVRQPMLAEQIVATELPGVLNWALEGLKRLLERGNFPPLPDRMQDIKDSAKRNANSVASWVDDCDVLIHDNGKKLKDDTYNFYARWAKRNGLSPVASNKFWERLSGVLPGLITKRDRIDGKQVQVANLDFTDHTNDDF